MLQRKSQLLLDDSALLPQSLLSVAKHSPPKAMLLSPLLYSTARLALPFVALARLPFVFLVSSKLLLLMFSAISRLLHLFPASLRPLLLLHFPSVLRISPTLLPWLAFFLIFRPSFRPLLLSVPQQILPS